MYNIYLLPIKISAYPTLPANRYRVLELNLKRFKQTTSCRFSVCACVCVCSVRIKRNVIPTSTNTHTQIHTYIYHIFYVYLGYTDSKKKEKKKEKIMLTPWWHMPTNLNDNDTRPNIQHAPSPLPTLLTTLFSQPSPYSQPTYQSASLMPLPLPLLCYAKRWGKCYSTWGKRQRIATGAGKAD